MALKRAAPSEIEVVGYDQDRKALSLAVKRRAIDRGEKDLSRAVRDAHLVVIATPILAIRSVMEALKSTLTERCVVTDTGSTKAQVLAWAEDYLPSSVDFVGGHPMAGKEVSGVENADPDLFKDASYCIIPSLRASIRSVEVVTRLVERVGAVPFFPEAGEHDALVAAVSHLPLILSSALVSTTTSSVSWREMSRLATSGFRDASRLASTDPEMGADICLTNQEAIEHWIDRFIGELEEYKRLVRDGGEELQEKLIEAREARERWLSGREEWPEGHRPEIPSVGQRLTGMLVGERLAQRTKEILSLQKYRSKQAGSTARDKEQGRETGE